jgi:ligand-binding sensor domain-containing protein/anti-sigma regulatory factor (Ser/Thr protein kinase)
MWQKISSRNLSTNSRWLSGLLCSFFLLVLTFVQAQQYTFIEYGLNEGLPQSQVRCIMQDQQGFIWIGTLGGLSKFDGKTFRNYDRQEGLLNNQINCILQAADGSIVSGSNGSFSIITGTEITSVELDVENKEATINALFQAQDQLWIGTENGLKQYSLSEGKWMPLKECFRPLLGSHIKAFHQQKNGGIWILTKETLFLYHEDKIIEFFTPQSTETTFFDMSEAENGEIWLASKGEGLIHLTSDGKESKNYLNFPDFSVSTITGVLIDQSNHLWLTSRFGFYEFDGNSFESITEKNGLKTPDVRDLIQDNEGNIWLGTYGNGLLKFTGKAFSSFTKSDGLSSDAVMSITQDLGGNLWFSTFDKGICEMIGDSILQFNLKEWTDNNRIWSSLSDRNGNLWFGSSDGLFRYANNRFDLFTEEDSLSHTMVLSLFEDIAGRIWIGTNKGLTIYENGKFNRVKNAGSPQKKVRAIKQDRFGRMWFAAIDGVYCLDGVNFNSYSQKDGLAENSTNCIEIDDKNRIWVGSQNGIAVLVQDHFQSFQIDENSGSNVINFLKLSADRIWIGTNNGLYSTFVAEEADMKNLQFRHYGLEDGLRSLETNLNSVFIDRQYRLWFGTTEGVTNLNTIELAKSRGLFAPKLNLTKIQINLLDIAWDQKFTCDKITGLPIEPRFLYKQNHLTFYFTGISLTYPNAVKYQYMLEGLDEDWKPLTQTNFATYSNLPYKSFVFRVRAVSAEGMMSEPLSYSFTIKPPFWLTWWFILLEVFIASSIVGYIVYNRRKAIHEKQEREWFEVKSKMLALEQQSLNSSMNRHFIFNALNSIQYYINRQDKLAANRYLSDFARLIRKNLDSSQDNLTSLRDEVERLELYLKLEHMRFKDKFDYKIVVDSALNQDEIRVPGMLIQPFLENSIWHGLLPKDSTGQVSVEIMKLGEFIEFTISDNGIGIENSLKNKTTTDSHISKGMEITQNRIELIKKSTGQIIELHGPHQIEGPNGQGMGTQVRIKLPLNFHELFQE